MAVNVCPADTVQAPVEFVWDLLMHPADYGHFLDMTVERLKPEGSAAPGQRIVGSTRALCRRFQFEGEVVEVDGQGHQIQFRMYLPLGIVSDNRISCTPIDAQSCILRFG